MTKKTIKQCLLMLCMLFLMTGALAVSAFAAERVVFVSDGGTGDGSSADKPLGTLAAAYAALGDEGGRIVLVDKVSLSAVFTEQR